MSRGLTSIVVRPEDRRRLEITIDHGAESVTYALAPSILDVVRFEGATQAARGRPTGEYNATVLAAMFEHLAVTAEGTRLAETLLALPYEAQQQCADALYEWYTKVSKPARADGGVWTDPTPGPSGSGSGSATGGPSNGSSPSTPRASDASKRPAKAPTP